MAWIMKIRNEFGEANTVPNNQHNLKIDELSQQIILLLQVNMCLRYMWEKDAGIGYVRVSGPG